MIQIKFVTNVILEKTASAAWSLAVIEGKENPDVPPQAIDAMMRKPYGNIVETFVAFESQLQRFIFARLKSDQTKTDREEAGAAIYQKALEGNERMLVVDIRQMKEDGLDLLTGILLWSWRFDRYIKQVKPQESARIDQLLVLCERPEELQQQFKRHQAIIKGVFFARTLTSEPANVLYPEAYAHRLKELEAAGVAVEIHDISSLRAMNMSALLAVGQGSANAPAVVVMKWKGKEAIDSQPIAIVGKGVCFDAGGLCLKPATEQLEMKWDKAGAGIVAGLMLALAEQNAPVYVVGIVGLVENMPDGRAMKPGDIIETKSGQTVEIVNTDAEGRLVLADCLWYAQETYNPKILIDLGTLTAETIASLGHSYAALYSNSSRLSEKLKAAAISSGEAIWELPMGRPFAKQIESDVADMKNMGVEFCGENGAAAEFLKRFIKNMSMPWAHIDIAGVSWTKENLPLCSKGATGFGVRLLEEWLSQGLFQDGRV